MAAIDRAVTAFNKSLKPPIKYTLSKWADEHFHLSAESSAEAGRWKTLPYQVGIMDAMTDPRIEQIWVQKSARVGYTKMINAFVAYHVDADPCSIMIVQPTDDDAKGYSKEEIAPMLRDMPCLKDKVSDSKDKNGDNNILQKNYPGGTLQIIGAHSGRGFRRVSRRVVIFDEIDAYKAEGAGQDGDQLALGIRRTEYFWNRKIVGGTTPLVKDHSRIEKRFASGDQRRYYVPCPQCGHFQYLQFKNLKWPEGNPREAYFICEHEGCVIEHKDKRSMVEKGEWRATAESSSPRIVSFHIWAAYSFSPNASWGQIATEFLESKADPNLLKTFVNTVLGETWEEEYSAKIGASELQDRAEFYEPGTAPEGVLVVTAGVDVQDNRLAIMREGWGNDEESWIIDYQEIMGDPAQPAVWKQLATVLSSPITREGGGVLHVRTAAIDSGGHYTHEVYQFARENRLRDWIAVKGQSQRNKPAIGKPTKVDLNFKGMSLKKGAQVYPMGSDTIKTTLFGRFKINEPGPKYTHFNTELTSDFYDQLTSEKQVTRYLKGQPIREWVKKPSQRNEALDCKVMSYAALQKLISGYNRATFWAQMAKVPIQKGPETKPIVDVSRQNSATQPRIRTNRTSFVNRFR